VLCGIPSLGSANIPCYFCHERRDRHHNRHAFYYLLVPDFRNINLIPAFNATETLRNVLAFIATGMYLRDHSFRQRNGVVYRRFD